MWIFRSPEIVFGDDALSRLEQLTGRKAFIVTDVNMVRLGHVQRVQERLGRAGLETAFFDAVEPEPSLGTVRTCAADMAEYAPDWVIGLGGGSCLDAAKVAWILYERPDLEPEAINAFESYGLRQRARFITIPTTAGTGAEVTAAAVIKDLEARRKLELATYEVVADLTIVDPVFTAEMPRSLTADTGIDALTHAVEGYTGTWANDLADGLCLQATRLIFTYLPRAVESGAADPEARERMANAATMAGLGMTNSHIALAHAMGHSAGVFFNLPHGRVTGLCLPYSIEFTAQEGAVRYADLARLIGCEVNDESRAAQILSAALRDLMRRVGLPLSLEEAGVDHSKFEASLDDLCDRCEIDASLITSRRVPTRAELGRLFEYAYVGKPVDF